jgi:hypothetical protein
MNGLFLKTHQYEIHQLDMNSRYLLEVINHQWHKSHCKLKRQALLCGNEGSWETKIISVEFKKQALRKDG